MNFDSKYKLKFGRIGVALNRALSLKHKESEKFAKGFQLCEEERFQNKSYRFDYTLKGF